MTTGKTIALTRWTFVGQVMSLLFTMLSSLVITFLPGSKSLLISWLQSPSAVSLELPHLENKLSHFFHCFPICLPWRDGTGCHDLSFWILSFKPRFSFSSLTFIKGLWFFFAFCQKGGVICVSEVIDISPANPDSSLCFIQPSLSHDVFCI